MAKLLSLKTWWQKEKNLNIKAAKLENFKNILETLVAKVEYDKKINEKVCGNIKFF